VEGPELRRIRRRLLLTQVTLGLRLKVTADTVSRWERDVHPIPEAVAQLARRWLDERKDEERQARGG
jgi:DNA-binding transcriptional regulator YiaG